MFGKLFSFLFPGNSAFFPLFNDAADNLVLASELLIKLVRERDLVNRLAYIKQIRDVEHTGDDITRKLRNELNSTFITPFDREDTHHLVSSMDDIVDYIHSASKRIHFYKVATFPEEFVLIADNIHAASKEIQNVLRSVKSVKDFKYHTQGIRRISEFEEVVDDIYQEYLAKLFEEEENAIELIKKRDILITLEKAIDKCDEVGKIFYSLILKMG
jgi:predicted phosphate transport protein (TIGR00153 family)